MNDTSKSTRENRLPRREFLAAAGVAAVSTLAGASASAAEPSPEGRVPLGLDGYSMRSMGWKATGLIEFAADQGLDALLLNGLNYFESLEASYLRGVKAAADRNDLRLYVGAGGVAANVKRFNDSWGGAEELLATAIRVAVELGSPVVNVKIGSLEDRFLDGGIQPRIDEAVRVLRAAASRARDAGVRFGFENHAGDLRSEELVTIVEQVGADVCGVMLDPGNGLWAMEDPMEHLQRLAPYTVCNSLRDYAVWPSSEGANFQWTAVGEGMMDTQRYVETLAQANPGMPVFVETISNSTRPIPFLTQEHWKAYPKLKASQIRGFLALVQRGEPLGVETPAEGQDRRAFQREHERAELLRSLRHLRTNCRAGIKPLEPKPAR